MMRWLLKSELETPLSLDAAASRLEFEHPSGTYRVILKEERVAHGAPLLIGAYVIFDADDIELAGRVGRDHLREFSETLALVTGSPTSVHRVASLWDWSP